jgi:hypothetical protein
VERPYVRPHPGDPNDEIIDVAALRDLVSRSAVVAFDSKHVDGVDGSDLLSLGFYEEPALESVMLDALRLVETMDGAPDEEDLREYAAGFCWYISPSGKGVDYSYFRSVCFFPPELIWNQGTYLPMLEGPLA